MEPTRTESEPAVTQPAVTQPWHENMEMLSRSSETPQTKLPGIIHKCQVEAPDPTRPGFLRRSEDKDTETNGDHPARLYPENDKVGTGWSAYLDYRRQPPLPEGNRGSRGVPPGGGPGHQTQPGGKGAGRYPPPGQHLIKQRRPPGTGPGSPSPGGNKKKEPGRQRKLRKIERTMSRRPEGAAPCGQGDEANRETGEPEAPEHPGAENAMIDRAELSGRDRRLLERLESLTTLEDLEQRAEQQDGSPGGETREMLSRRARMILQSDIASYWSLHDREPDQRRLPGPRMGAEPASPTASAGEHPGPRLGAVEPDGDRLGGSGRGRETDFARASSPGALPSLHPGQHSPEIHGAVHRKTRAGAVDAGCPR